MGIGEGAVYTPDNEILALTVVWMVVNAVMWVALPTAN